MNTWTGPRPTGASTARDSHRWLWTALWAVLGAAWVLGALTMLTIGAAILAGALAGTVLLARSPRACRAWDGLLFGAGLPLVYVAVLNVGGPASCPTSGSGSASGSAVETCADKLNPWPWFLISATVLAGAVIVRLVRHRRAAVRATAIG